MPIVAVCKNFIYVNNKSKSNKDKCSNKETVNTPKKAEELIYGNY